MTEIKPAAWVERTEAGHDRMWSGDLSAWANRPSNPEPLYDWEAMKAMLELVSDAGVALADLGACSDESCAEPNCLHVLPRIRALQVRR